MVLVVEVHQRRHQDVVGDAFESLRYRAPLAQQGPVWVEQIELGGVGEDEYSLETVGLELGEESGRIAGGVKRKSDLAVHDDCDGPQCVEELPLLPGRG